MQRVWRIELLGTLKAIREGQVITRFRTRRVASLLGYLSYFRQQIHSRDEIAEMLWPDLDIAISRRNLRQALSSLRLALEPAPLPNGSVVLAIHDGIQLNAETVTSDVAEFERLIDQSKLSEKPERASELLRQAVRAYKGELLPGFNDEWIWSERIRLEDLYLSALRKLSENEDADEAIAYLRNGVVREPFDESWHLGLIRRYIEIDRPDKALEQFTKLESSLAEGLGKGPSNEALALAKKAKRALDQFEPPTTPKARTSTKPDPNERRVSLPVFANRYFGRAEEIRAVCAFMEETQCRLLTILGPAGVGKTRLSVQCASILAERNDWNVFFVPLADRFNAAELYEAIGAAMEPQLGAPTPEIGRILELTEGRKTLLVLDNLEQIADEAGYYVAQLLAKAPQISCLASSRQPLQIQDEQLFAIEPLPVPHDEQHDLSELALIPSVQLFVDRCQTIRPDLQLSERNSEAIVTLCSRLDGLPLAIEIVAGLSNAFSPSQMVHHLPLKLTELTSRLRDLPARHKSLRAAIDWSFDSLPQELQSLFLQLCVFRGGFRLEAAAEIYFSAYGSSKIEACLVALQSLQERSLIGGKPSEDGREPRFSVLTAFREYAEEQISADELATVRERHAEYFASQTPPDRPFASVDEQTALHLEIELDYDNHTSAIDFSLSAANLERCIRLLGILATRWLSRGPRATERRLIMQIAGRDEVSSLPAPIRVQLQRMLGTAYIRSGEYAAAYEACTVAIEIALPENDPLLLATCYSGLSVCTGYLGRFQECLELNQKVLELAGDDNLVLAERSYLGMGSVYVNLGRLSEASESFDHARTISMKLRGGEPDALIVINQARVALDQGQTDESLRLTHEAIRISKRLHDEFTLAVALTIVSRYHRLTGNLQGAVAANLEALERFRQGDFLFWILQCLQTQASLWIDLGRFQETTTLLAATSSHGALEPDDEPDALEKLRTALSPEKFERAWAKGLALDRREAIRLASAPQPFVSCFLFRLSAFGKSFCVLCAPFLRPSAVTTDRQSAFAPLVLCGNDRPPIDLL